MIHFTYIEKSFNELEGSLRRTLMQDKAKDTAKNRQAVLRTSSTYVDSMMYHNPITSTWSRFCLELQSWDCVYLDMKRRKGLKIAIDCDGASTASSVGKVCRVCILSYTSSRIGYALKLESEGFLMNWGILWPRERKDRRCDAAVISVYFYQHHTEEQTLTWRHPEISKLCCTRLCKLLIVSV